MPWTVADVDKHKKGLTPAQKKKWVSIANGVLKDCKAKGGKGCDAKAIRVANSNFSEKEEIALMGLLNPPSIKAVVKGKFISFNDRENQRNVCAILMNLRISPIITFHFHLFLLHFRLCLFPFGMKLHGICITNCQISIHVIFYEQDYVNEV